MIGTVAGRRFRQGAPAGPDAFATMPRSAP